MKDERLLEMRVFKTVVETGGFTAAANVLNVSQPFVSQSVNNLERRLGVQLLHRSTRTMRLTGEGERFLRSCNEILETLEEAEAQVRSSEPTGNLRVSAPHAFGMDQLVPQLPRFLAAYPKLCVHFSLSDSNVNLIEDNFDIAVRMGRLQDSSLRSRKLCNLQRIVVASPAYLAAHGQPVTPQGLTKHTCLTWESPREHLNQWPFMINGKLERVAVRGSFRSTDGAAIPVVRGGRGHHAACRTSRAAGHPPRRTRAAPLRIRSEGRYRDPHRLSSRAASGAAHSRLYRSFRRCLPHAAMADGVKRHLYAGVIDLIVRRR